MRPGRRFGVILHAEHGLGHVPQALHGAVIEIEVRDLHVVRDGVWVDREPVVLRRDFDLAGLQILDGVIAAAVAELQLERARATKSSGLWPAPVAITPRIAPTDRNTRVSARVSTSAIATMLCSVR